MTNRSALVAIVAETRRHESIQLLERTIDQAAVKSSLVDVSLDPNEVAMLDTAGAESTQQSFSDLHTVIYLHACKRNSNLENIQDISNDNIAVEASLSAQTWNIATDKNHIPSSTQLDLSSKINHNDESNLTSPMSFMGTSIHCESSVDRDKMNVFTNIATASIEKNKNDNTNYLS